MSADLGERLVAFGTVLVYLSATLDVTTRDARTTCRVGRAVLVVAGWVVHPLVALHRRLGESPTERCARTGHRATWDGYHERCTRCERRHLEVYVNGPLDPDADVLRAPVREEWVYPDDPRVIPQPLRVSPTPTPPTRRIFGESSTRQIIGEPWRVDLRVDVEATLRADAERLRADVRRAFDVPSTATGDPLRDVTRRELTRHMRDLERRLDELRPYRPRDNPWRIL